MTRRPDDHSTDSRVLNALTRLARDAVRRPSAAQLDRGLHLLVARSTAHKSRRAKVLRWSSVGLFAALCTLLSVVVAKALRGRASEPPAVEYRVEGGSVLAGGYLRDSGDDGVRLVFNEGTKVSLMPGARGRVRSADKDGSRVVLDQGTASFDVARSKDRRWLVEAGPFSVAVKGTLFTVSWDPPTERFELRLRHGKVVVSGPIATGDIELRAGQRLVVDLPKAETLIIEEPADGTTAVASSSIPSPSALHEPTAPGLAAGQSTLGDIPEAIRAPAATTSSTASKVERRSSWTEHLAHGHWDLVLEDVERRGVEATLETAPSEDLFALADAARYRRRSDLARAALLAQRRRFPASSRSIDATFLLGRVEEARDRARAIAWYDEYLKRAATGTYAAEAWGRKMVLTNELKGRSLARPIAEEYLRRFPRGSYTEAARALCAEP
jgi:ferric-dicitrate binding protein FerR (iron transport regulator)